MERERREKDDCLVAERVVAVASVPLTADERIRKFYLEPIILAGDKQRVMFSQFVNYVYSRTINV